MTVRLRLAWTVGRFRLQPAGTIHCPFAIGSRIRATIGVIGAIGVGAFGFLARPAIAQIIPDATLPQASIALDRETGIELRGGTIAGSNVFHSFEQFVLRDGTRATFVTPDGIDRILARVTGSAIAEIDGTLAANADLIFLAPNGIRFGDRASLDLSGSLIATTAHAINFSDGLTWPSIATDQPPLLSVNVPVGLQFDAAIAPGTITVSGSGQAITAPSIATNLLRLLLSPKDATIGAANVERSESVLATAPGQTLGLIGGNIDVQRTQLDAPSGTIVIGGVRSGRVDLDNLDQSQGASLDFQAADLGGRIQLRDQAALTANGFPNGSITLAAESIAINGGAFAQLQNFDTTPGGHLSLTAIEDISINGTPQDGQGSFVSTETFGDGRSGDIVISADRLVLLDGASTNTLSYSAGMAGNLIVDVGDRFFVRGFKPGRPEEVSNISSTTLATGNGGDIRIRGRQLVLEEGGAIATSTTGSGRSGDIQIEAGENVRLQGTEPDSQGSSLGTGTINIGNAGNVEINTPRLSLIDGARVGSLSVGSGHAGNVTLNSAVSITLNSRDSIVGGSSIASSAESITTSTLLPRFVLEIIPNLAEIVPTGNAGDLTITTPLLQVQNGGRIQVANLGFGNPGRLFVLGDTLRLESGGVIAAQTVTGSGSAIDLDLRLLEINNGSIMTTTVSTGQGSDIRIRASDRVLVTASSLRETESQALGLFFSSADIPDFSIGIISGSAGAGKAGNIEIEAGELILRDGGLITPSALRSGDAGSLTLRVAGDIVIDGGILTTATISQASDAGRGGDMVIEAENLSLLNGGSISTTTLGRNNAGSLNANIRDRLLIVGGNQSNLLSMGGLSSGALRLGTGSVGNGGELSISAQRLVLQNQGRISSSSEGLGNAGNINIDVESLILDDNAAIVASSDSGEGGNLAIRSRSSAVLQDTSELSTQAGNAILGGGNGGNLSLNTGVFAAIGGSRISANAFSGSGGQILIEARGFFLGDRSNIDASSQLGIDGVVEVNNDTIVTDPSFVSLSSELLTHNLLAQDCAASNRDRFSIVDHGRTLGLVDRTLETTTAWHDDRDWRELMPPETEPISADRAARSSSSFTSNPRSLTDANPPVTPQTYPQTHPQTDPHSEPTAPREFIEASRWDYDDGHIQLVEPAAVMLDNRRSSSCESASSPSSEMPITSSSNSSRRQSR